MKLLTATMATNGLVPHDYSHCIPGELLWLPMVCSAHRLHPDSRCGCTRGFGGLSSHRGTTTALVEDRNITVADLRAAVRSSLTDQGLLDHHLSTQEQHDLVDEVVHHIRDIADFYHVGSVIRRRLDEVYTHTGRAA